ncbi:hypothetical protein CFC21_055693 [Triticum aestivum]|uniref:Protein kinase domain-containing protein n=2 Tax=Triticum aestivum TaxID=4565 RepID=A0A9R1KAB3_WHEAT|nr:proline-rich receptor-like protein kinase PERK9 isoform X3 [Triticum aestivum]KAF7046676.1 hypothetical protein CFC21_055693 [Triticum aestivum]
MKKIVLKLDIHYRKQRNRALRALSTVHGIDQMAVDMRDEKITVVGTVDPVAVVRVLRKLFPTAQLVSVGPWPAKEEKKKDGDKKAESGPPPPHEFTVGFLNRITNGFSGELIIGRGRHGVVYKGMQDNGEWIAVKKLHLMPGLDDEEFKNEFNNLMRVRHQNTIWLVGYCCHTTEVPVEHNGEHVSARVEERALCSEYLHGGSLDKHLSNEPCALVWHTCYKIIKGICQGLRYLHEGFEYPIYHLELKPTKILLDKDMMPKIGGFGFSKLFDSIKTFDSSEVTGTSVYMPPEYISQGKISPKFDVFSVGVIILQIMVGKQSYTKCADIPPEEFIEHVYELWVSRMHAIISKNTSREIRTCIKIALKCVESDRVKRPTINKVIEELNKIVECSFESLEHITDNFSEQNIVGRGGYGTIYKGVQDNGEEVAVKRLHSNSMPWIEDEQFKNELDNLMRVQHKNIVRLVGYCYHKSQILVEYNGELVYATMVKRAICLEYMQGGSLEYQLSDEPCRLDWEKCYNIIKGTIDGLHCLHNTHIFHLDLKPANILLDKDMVAKIGDFGLSRLFGSMQTYMTASHIKGTFGYMPPEYIDGQVISQKFDVFSLGVIMIQIMAGKEGYSNYPRTPRKEFIKHVCEKWRVRLQATMWAHVFEEVRTCIEIALKCVEADRKRRPTIAQIVNELSNIGVAKSSPIGQWTNKLTSLKTLLLSTHLKQWLFLLVAVIAIFFAWPQLCPDSWHRGITRSAENNSA